jgi:putative ABC transport system permease protein
MRNLLAFLKRLANFFHTNRRERDLSAEMESHLQIHIEDNLRSGMSPQEARRQAHLKLGGLEQTKQNYRDRRGLPFLETLLRDLRFGARVLRKNPGFTFVVVFTLALGIGANTAIFSVLESQLWRPLPFPDSERLVDAHTVLRENHRQWDVLSYNVYQAWRQQNHSFTNLGAYDYPNGRNLTAGGTSERVQVMPITSTLYDTLQVPPERGRGFAAEEESPGRDHVVILSHSLWQSRFGSDAAIIGKPILIDGEPYVVVGIAPPRLRFEYIEEPAIYVPLTMDPAQQAMRNTYVIARLAPGVTPEMARTELSGILDRHIKSEGLKPESTASVTNLRETWTEFSARSLYFFAGAVLLVLLIACVNNTGLLLARGLARQREFTLRATLGASRGILIRQSLVESFLLSLAGGAAGILLGIWGAEAFAAFIPQDILPRNTQIVLDSHVLLFVLGVAISSALIMGIIPALLASRVDLNKVLRQSGAGVSASRSQNKTRSALVVIEVALALVLLFGAGLFLSSFIRLRQAPRGFDAPGALTFRVSLRGDNYAQPDQQQRYFRGLRDQLRALPGVQAVALGSGLPLAGSPLFASVNIAGRPPHGKYGVGVIVYAVDPDFFRVLHMRLLKGRSFDPHDTESSARIAIINRNAAQTLFGSDDPLGSLVEFVPDPERGVPAEPPVQIVGVMENVQEFNANEVPFEVIYMPLAQHPVRSVYTVVASGLPRGALLGSLREVAYSLDKDQPIYEIQTMDDLISGSVRGAQFDLLIVTILALGALALVSVGIFGTVAYFVERRTQEFGIRLALGATPAQVVRHAVTQSMLMGLMGVLCGIAGSLVLGRMLRHALYLVPHEHSGMLYRVPIYDPLSMSLACLALFAVLILATYIPARRSMRVDPITALRYE